MYMLTTTRIYQQSTYNNIASYISVYITASPVKNLDPISQIDSGIMAET